MADEITQAGITESVCPICLARIGARRVARREDLFLEKECPAHGPFRTILWRGPPSWEEWVGRRPSPGPVHAPAPGSPGCPYECGLCADHRRPSCCVLLEVTGRCNLRCPICFAGAGEGSADPGLPELEARLRALREGGRPLNIQLSGGEPTTRDDLPAVVALARALGFDFLQINTNGLRLAREPAYARALAEAGLSCVFLQFDGVTDDVYRRLRGASLLAEKTAALDRCAEAGLGVVLVPTLVPGVNTGQLGAVIALAASRGPALRGVHFQPVSYFGRYPTAPADVDRITLPEVLRGIEEQTGGAIRAGDFHPASAEHPACSFSGSFQRGPDGGLIARPRAARSCCGSGGGRDETRRARDYVAQRWAGLSRWGGPMKPVPPIPPARSGAGSAACPAARNGPEAPDSCCSGPARDGLDEVIARATEAAFCISGMVFQDAWTLDLERLRECIVHVADPTGRVVPFCAYNATSAAGASLHRRRGA